MDRLIVLTGPNASGKSGLGVKLALKQNAEIVSADSRQVYKGLDLGSGKITKEEMKGVPHHLLDSVQPGTFYTLADFQKEAYEAIDGIHKRGRQPFLVGGTGLYVNAVTDGYVLTGRAPDLTLRKELDKKTPEELIEILKVHGPEFLEGADLKNRQRLERFAERALENSRVNSKDGALTDEELSKRRETADRAGKEIQREKDRKLPRYEALVLGTLWPRELLYERIRVRLDRRLEQGMIEEVETLRKNGVTDEFLYRLGLEYRYILLYLRGEFASFQSFYDKLFMEIRHLAKEQMTWFRKRKGLHWVDMTGDPEKEANELIERFLQGTD